MSVLLDCPSKRTGDFAFHPPLEIPHQFKKKYIEKRNTVDCVCSIAWIL